MAKIVMPNALITVSGVDLSDHCSEVSIEDEADAVDITGYSPAAFETEAVGLKDLVITATFFQDYATNEVHQVLRAIYEGAGTTTVAVRADVGAVSTTNPMFILTARMYNYDPLSAVVDDAVTLDVEFRNASPSGMVIDYTGTGGGVYPSTTRYPSTTLYPTP